MQRKTALLSVYHKDGIVEFAKALVAHGKKLVAG
jgi:AICAR transformylase/IMP cyclohydrolase PurH